jgi:hypothetical protein
MSITNKDALATTGASFYIHNDEYDSVVWNSPEITKPTLKWCQDKKAELQAIEDANQYQRDRQYPSIGDQLDMQYHDQIDGTTTWKDAIAKVKADNPKEAE